MKEEKKHSLFRRKPLTYQYVVLTLGIAIIALAVFSAWSYSEQNRQITEQMLAEARVLESSVQATWEFIDYEQANINTDRDGVYNFKGIYCSLVGKSVGKIFSMNNDDQYSLRYTRVSPRNIMDEPDSFEQEAFNAFYSQGSTEYYDVITDERGDRVFRYVGAIELTENCMDCHGGPKDEIDVTGFKKEGMSVGDIGGAVSIIIPTDLYQQGVTDNTLRTVIFFALFLSVAFATSALFFQRSVVKPLNTLGNTMHGIAKGNMNVDLENIGGTKEVSELADEVKSMSGELDTLHRTLEEKVDNRTRLYKEANEMLDHQREQIAQANKLLTEANEQLQEENEYRTNIIAILSHELRTPLTAILAFVDLWESSDSESNEEDAEYVEKIKLHSLSLLEMVNNVLDMARIESGMTDIAEEPVDLVDLIEDIRSFAEPLSRRKNISFDTHFTNEVPLIVSDWSQLNKILTNLVSNAIKFTPDDGKVDLIAEYEENSRTLRIEVRDNGIGIAAEYLEGIFDRFVQADASASRKYSGSGLGLSLVKKTAEILGGSVSVSSKQNVGSTFTVVLPVTTIQEEDFDEDSHC